MSQLKDLLAFQNADLKLQQTEEVIKGTENRKRFSRLHKQLKDMQDSIAKQGADLAQVEAVLTRLQSQADAAAKRLQLESSEFDTLLGDSETTAEEMTEFIHDIENLDKEWAALEREAQAATAAVQKLAQEYNTTRRNAARIKKEYDEVRALCEEEKAQGAAAVKTATEAMEAAKKRVAPALAAKYDRARKYFSAPVVTVLGDKCSGCKMSLPGNLLRQLSASDEICECENCGRLLYLE